MKINQYLLLHKWQSAGENNTDDFYGITLTNFSIKIAKEVKAYMYIIFGGCEQKYSISPITLTKHKSGTIT